MAYKEFEYENTYAKPDTKGLTDGIERGANHAIISVFNAIAHKKEERDKKADAYNFALAKGTSENDNVYFEAGARAVTDMMKNAIRSNDRGSLQQATNVMKTLQEQNNERRVQDEKFKVNEDNIKARETKDPYYDGSIDRKANGEWYFGKDHDANVMTRSKGDEVSAIAGNNPRALKIHQYTADYVKDVGTKEKVISTGNPNATSTRLNKSPFWDNKTGKMGVTEQHAVDYLKSRPDGSVQQFYETKISDDLDNEIKQMKSVKDNRTEWMKGLSDIEIKDALIKDPSKNLINKDRFGVRIRNAAKSDLENAATTYSKVDVEYKSDNSKTGGLYKNDSIAHSDTFHNENVGTENVSGKVGLAFKIRNAAPGGILMINKGTTTGKPITFESSSKNIFNVNSGTSQQARGTSTFNLTGYQVQAYDKSGKPYMIEAENENDFVNAINKIPLSDFKNLEPRMQVALKGYSINKGKLLGDIRTSTYSLSEQLAKARESGNADQVAKVEGQMYEMENLKKQLNGDGDDFVDEDILNAAAKNGITSVKTDQLVKGDKADLDKLNAITEGLNLSNRDKWSTGMKSAAEAFEKRAQEAAASGYQEVRTPKKKSASKANTDKPKTVKQGDFIYTLNEKTGEYE